MGAGEFLLGKQPGTQGAVFPWTPDQRRQAGDAAFNTLGSLYGAQPPPSAYWGGPDSWTTAGGLMNGAPDWNSLIQSILSGGPVGHATGAAAHAGKINLTDEALQMLPSERIRQDVYGGMSRSLNADASNRLMQLREQQALTGSAGDASSPAALWMQQQIQRDKQRALAEGETGFEAAFSKEAGARRAQALISQAQFVTQASIATAGNKTSASIANAQMATAAGGRQQQGAEFLLGAGLNAAAGDEDRMLARYRALNEMNLDWQRPVVNPFNTPGAQGQLGNLFNLGRNLADTLGNRGGGQPNGGYQGSPSDLYDYSGNMGTFSNGGFTGGFSNNTGAGPGGDAPTENGPMVGPDGQIVSTSNSFRTRNPWG